MSRMLPRPLVFIHIPKAAGTTLRSLLLNRYGADRTFNFTGDPGQRERFLGMSPEERGAFDLLQGHVQFGIHRALPEPALQITMLRDPVDRVASLYYFIHADQGHFLHEGFKRTGISLRDWIRNSPFVADNIQIRWLIQAPMESIPPGRLTRAHLEEAKWNLESAFEVVGLSERFDEFVSCLYKTFGWQLPRRIPRYNVNAARPRTRDIDPETVAAIRDLNHWELELYEHACSLFEAQCRRLKIDISFAPARPLPERIRLPDASTPGQSVAPVDPHSPVPQSWPPRFPHRPVILQSIPLACHGLAQIVVSRQYDDDAIHRFTGHAAPEENFKTLPEGDRAVPDLLIGPVHYGIQRALPGRAPFLTMLRNPVERLIAHYYLVIGSPNHYLHKRVTSAGWTLYDYLANQPSIELDNDQVRWLNARPHKFTPLGKVSRLMLDDARRALEHDDTIFGIAEYFDESLLIFARAMGWQDVRYFDPGLRSRVPLASTVPSGTIDLIHRSNALDIELYEFARSRFEERLRQLGEPFQEQLRDYQAQNAALVNHPHWSNHAGEGEKAPPSGTPVVIQTRSSASESDQAAPPRDIVWIASYPRSGNTWLRFLIDAYFFPPARFLQEVGRLSAELDWWLLEASRRGQPREWIPGAVRQAQARYARPEGCPSELFFKTHHTRTPSHPFIERTRCAIHLIRDPRDVLLSGMNFSELTDAPDASLASAPHALGNGDTNKERQYARAFIASRGDPIWLETGYGRWAEHARSWMAASPSAPGGSFPVLTIRYEDLKADPHAGLERILEFLGVAPDRHRVRDAVEHCSLTRLRNLEVASRALTDMVALKDPSRHFFNKGLSGQSLAALGEEIERAFDAAFAADARELGYA